MRKAEEYAAKVVARQIMSSDSELVMYTHKTALVAKLQQKFGVEIVPEDACRGSHDKSLAGRHSASTVDAKAQMSRLHWS